MLGIGGAPVVCNPVKDGLSNAFVGHQGPAVQQRISQLKRWPELHPECRSTRSQVESQYDAASYRPGRFELFLPESADTLFGRCKSHSWACAGWSVV